MENHTLRSVLGALVAPAYIPVFFLAFSWAAVTPVLPQYLGGLGAGVATIGLVVSMKGFGQLTSDLPGGFIIARWGLRRIVVTSYIFSIIVNAVLFCVRGIPWIAAFVFISGFFTSILITAIMTLVRTTVVAGMRGRALSGVGGAVRVGMLIGPVAGGIIAERLGVPAIFLIRAAAFGAGLMSYLISDRHAPDDISSGVGHGTTVIPRRDRTSIAHGIAQLRKGLTDRWYTVLIVGFAILVLSILRSSREVILPLWGERLLLSPTRIGIAMSVGASFDLLLFIPSGIISDRFGRKAAVTICLVGFSVGLLVILPAQGVPLYLLATVIVGIGNGFGAGINMTTGTDLAPGGAVAEFLGLWRLYGDLGAAAGPAIVGALSAVLTLGPAVAITAGIGLFGALVMATIAPETRDLNQ